MQIKFSHLNGCRVVGHAGGDGNEDGDDGVDALVEQRHGGSTVDEVGQRIDQFFPCVEWRKGTVNSWRSRVRMLACDSRKIQLDTPET